MNLNLLELLSIMTQFIKLFGALLILVRGLSKKSGTTSYNNVKPLFL